MLIRLLPDRPGCAAELLLPRLLLLGCLALAFSCSALTSPAVVRGPRELNSFKTADDVAAQTKVKVDSFKNTTFISGPTFNLKDPISGTLYGGHWHLWTRTSDSMCYLSFTDWRRDWAFFDNAADAQGQRFSVSSRDTRVISGNFVEESLYMVVPLTYLRAHAESGTTIKVWGRRGEEVFEVPGFYITGFLQTALAADK